MNPTYLDLLSLNDTAAITELMPVLGITCAKRLEKGGERKLFIETSCGR